MTESLSTSTDVSRRVYADMRTAFRTYTQNSLNTASDESIKNYTENGQLTRRAFRDMQNNIAEKSQLADKEETKQASIREQQANNTSKVDDAAEANNAQAQEKVEAKNFTLPKNTQTIISELKRNGMHRTMTEYDIAREYGISYMNARQILDEVNKDSNGFVREYNLPQNTTVSYKVF